MLKSISQLQVKVDNKDFFFHCENDSSFPMIKEAFFQMQKYIGAVEDQIKAHQAEANASKDDDKPPEVVQ